MFTTGRPRLGVSWSADAAGHASASGGSSGGCGLGSAGALLIGSVLTVLARRRAAWPS